MNLIIALKKDKMMKNEDDEENDMDHPDDEDMRKEMMHMETMSVLKKMLEKLTNMDKNSSTVHAGGG